MKKVFIYFLVAVSAILVFPYFVWGGALINVADTPANFVVSTATTHTISFATATSDTIGKVTIAFNPGFTLSGVTLGMVTGLATGTLSVSADTIIYSITTPETVSATTSCTITLCNITNAAVCATTYTIIVSTRTAEDTIIDGPTTSNTFALLSNSLKITTLPQVLQTDQISSAIKVIACDSYGNTDTLFSNTISISGSSSTRRFSPNGTLWTSSGSDTSITLVSGFGQFYYKDTSTGVVDISVSRSGYTPYVQSFKITPFLTGFIPSDTSVTVILSSGGTTITIPSGTFASTICLAINDTPTSSAITNANNNSASDLSGSLKLVSELSGTTREIAAFAVVSGVVDYSQPLNPQAGKSVTITIPYQGVSVSGSAEDGLRIFRLDENTQGWILLSDPQTVNKIAKTVSKSISSFSFYRLISLGVAQNLSDVIVYPNPFEFAKARDETLKFVNLPTQATIRIYDVAGELVRTLQKDSTINRVTWDGKNEYGEKVATGIYIYVISSPQDLRKGKIAVIASQ